MAAALEISGVERVHQPVGHGGGIVPLGVLEEAMRVEGIGDGAGEGEGDAEGGADGGHIGFVAGEVGCVGVVVGVLVPGGFVDALFGQLGVELVGVVDGVEFDLGRLGG